jgi:hypothetical protein
MDSQTFDRLVADAARHPTRRATFRILAGGLLGGLFAQRAVASARAAQRSDRDNDGLFDDDEVEVYGTDPDVADTDGDGVDDGEEIFNRDSGLPGPSDPLTYDGGDEAPPPDDTGEAPPMGVSKGLREICTPGADICRAPYQCDAPTTRHTCSSTVAGVSAWCCVPPGGSCTECDCCGNYYCAYDDNNVASCQPNPEG